MEAFEVVVVYLTMPRQLVVFVQEEPFLLAKKEEAFLVVRALIYLQLVVSQQFLKLKKYPHWHLHSPHRLLVVLCHLFYGGTVRRF